MAHDADDARLRAEEAALARRAADGDGSAFAELYDRYERRIYTFCHRLVGSEHDAADATQEAFVKVLDRLPKLRDRDLHFAGYLFTAARNASYDMIGKRTRSEAVDEIPELGSRPVYGDAGDRLDLDPERAAMLSVTQEQVQSASARLPDRQREVLALRELQELSYDEIGEIMGMKRNAVAQLISRARIKLRTELQVGAVAAVRPATPEEERIAQLIAERMDGELRDPQEVSWLTEQLRENPRARVMEESLLEAGTSYRGLTLLVPALWLRDATVAQAAERVGADWSAYTREASVEGGAAGGGGAAQGPTALLTQVATDVEKQDRRRRAGMYAAAAVGLLLLLVLASQLVPDRAEDRPVGAAAPATTTATQPSATTAAARPTATSGKTTTTTEAPAPAVAGADASTTPVGAPVAAPVRTTTRSPKTTPSSSGIVDEGGGGSGRQGAGSAPLPPDPQPAPTPTPEPAPTPAPVDPPVVTTPAATTPPTPTKPCRPTANFPCK